MAVGKVYSRHIISLLIEFAVKMNSSIKTDGKRKYVPEWTGGWMDA